MIKIYIFLNVIKIILTKNRVKKNIYKNVNRFINNEYCSINESFSILIRIMM